MKRHSQSVAKAATTYTRVAPSGVNIVQGLLASGDATGLAKPDALLYRVSKALGAGDTDPVIFETTSTLPTNITTLTSFVYRQTSRMSAGGSFTQKVELFNYDTGTWDTTDVGTFNGVPTYLRNKDLTATGSLWRYVRTSDRQIKARVTVTPNSPGMSSSWTIETDQGAWIVKP
jgi:hypothetical protein